MLTLCHKVFHVCVHELCMLGITYTPIFFFFKKKKIEKKSNILYL
jgi:hypothetical protein